MFESVEYLVETPGEDIPHLHIRPYYKHRGLEKRFEGMPVAAGVLLAERVEGIASVAHALAYSHAVETLTDVHVPLAGQLVRVLHAELERLANHLDVAVRLAEAAGLAVAQARFGRAQGTGACGWSGACCGSRFGRGVVVPGGSAGLPRLGRDDLLRDLDRIERGRARGPARADGDRVVPGPAARHRPAHPGPGPRSTAPSARSGGPPAPATTSGPTGPTTPTAGCRPRRHARSRGMRWPA